MPPKFDKILLFKKKKRYLSNILSIQKRNLPWYKYNVCPEGGHVMKNLKGQIYLQAQLLTQLTPSFVQKASDTQMLC